MLFQYNTYVMQVVRALVVYTDFRVWILINFLWAHLFKVCFKRQVKNITVFSIIFVTYIGALYKTHSLSDKFIFQKRLNKVTIFWNTNEIINLSFDSSNRC